MSSRDTGTLKFFDGSKGFGFIERENGDDVFLHIQGGFRDEDRPDSDRLEEGVRLEFTVVHTEKGPQAKGAQVLQGAQSGRTGDPRSGSSPFQVPRDTAPLFEAHRTKTRNLALRIEKAAPFENGEPPDIPDDFSFSEFDKNRIQRRHDAHRAAIRQRPGVEVATLNASVDWRLAVGLGRASVYENGITLDAVDGMPYVPGSGVKGALRTFLINAVYRPELDDPSDQGGKAEELAFQDPLFCTLFGTPTGQHTRNDAAERGRVAFHEAYPSEVPAVEADIMNPHYQEYYQGTAPPTDDMNPTIITFLTVRETAFTFLLSTQNSDAPADGLLLEATPADASGSSLELTAHWLRRLLTESGLGAKTSAGYGFFALNEE